MSEISNKKRKFIKRNFKQLSIEELVLKTGLKPGVIRSLIDEYTVELPGKAQSAHIKHRSGISLSWKTILFTFLLFTAVAIIIYSPCLHGDFVSDDQLYIYDASSSVHISRLSQLTDILFSKVLVRRIGLISFALNYYFGGLNTFGYHLVNVIIHILNGLILFLLSYTILTLPSNEGKGSRIAFKISFLGSLIWLVHPIQTQSVSYIWQRLASLSTLFFLLSLLCYIKGRLLLAHKRVALFICSVIFGLLALGTKQNTATLPLFVIFSEFLFFQPKSFKLDRKKLGIIILLGGSFILISVIYLTYNLYPSLFDPSLTPFERGLTQLRVVIFYLSLLIYPHPSRLNVDHDFSISHSLFSPFTTFLSLLFIIGSIGLAIFLMKRNRLVSFAILWFFGNMVIESSIIPLELVFEHRLYLPSMGLITLVTALCFSLLKGKRDNWIAGLSILLILLFSYWTYERASVWRGSFSLWKDAAQKSPHKSRPHHGLGLAYDDKGMLDEAIFEYKKALTIKPNDAKAHSNLGAAYDKKGMFDEAIFEYKKALAIKPNYAEVHNNLGLTYENKGMFDEAIFEYKKALTIKPNDAKAHSNLGIVYRKKDRLDEAISEFK
jgi:tetratricopeptide (TPR) repeat protein